MLQLIVPGLNLIYRAVTHITSCLRYCRGLSSVVRKCVNRETGREFAVKIIDMQLDENISHSIVAEIEVLTSLPSHRHISE